MKNIGIDAVDIDRFKKFHLYKTAQLTKIYTQEEIAYCLENPLKSAERFAVRFAAKEAFFKALSSYANTHISLFTLVKLVEIKKDSVTGSPSLFIDWSLILSSHTILPQHTSLSLTHTKTTALAVVCLY